MTEVVVMIMSLYALAIMMVLSRMALDLARGVGMWTSVRWTLPCAVFPLVLSFFDVRIMTIAFFGGVLTALMLQNLIVLVRMRREDMRLQDTEEIEEYQQMQQQYQQQVNVQQGRQW